VSASRDNQFGETLSVAVAALYDSVFQVPFAEFQGHAVDSVMNLLDADAALWATGVRATQSILSMTLRNIAPDELINYQQTYFEHDYVFDLAASLPGTPIRREDFGSEADHAAMPVPINFGWAERIHHSMTTTSSSTETDVSEAISVFRTDRTSPFSESDRDLKRLIFPHLIAAWRHRQLLQMYESTPQSARTHRFSQRGNAVIDDEGRILTADALFTEKLRSAFSDWNVPMLPKPLARILSNATGTITAGGLDCLLTRGEHRHIISVTSASAGDQLTRSETRVAAMFAKGHSHTEIATHIGVSQSTVRNQISSVYKKLDIHSKVDLVRLVA
jgi:DNA-binding CsgD family transcriptional regulator